MVSLLDQKPAGRGESDRFPMRSTNAIKPEVRSQNLLDDGIGDTLVSVGRHPFRRASVSLRWPNRWYAVGTVFPRKLMWPRRGDCGNNHSLEPIV